MSETGKEFKHVCGKTYERTHVYKLGSVSSTRVKGMREKRWYTWVAD